MGNRAGWMIAGGLVLAVGLALVVGLVVRGQTTPPTEATAPPALELHTVEMPVRELSGFTPSEPGNAADDYRQAVRRFHAEKDELFALASQAMQPDGDLSAEQFARLEAVYDRVRTGTSKADCRYAVEEFRLAYEQPAVRKLQSLSGLLRSIGLYHQHRGEWDQAREAFQHELVLGRHLMSDRVRAPLVSAGVGIQTDALSNLEGLYQQQGGHLNTLSRISDYRTQLRDVSELYRQKRDALWPQPHPGDTFNIIANDADRAWQVEGLLALGILKFTQAGHEGNSARTEELIQTYLDSDDPHLARAARVADGMTRDILARQYELNID